MGETVQLERVIRLSINLLWLAVAPSLADAPKHGDDKYIPKDAADAVRVLNSELSEEDKKQLLQDPVADNGALGVRITNEWNLWAGSRLSTWFDKRGVHQPEDMAAIIIKALAADTKNKPFDLSKALQDTKEAEQRIEQESKDAEVLQKATMHRIKTMMMGLELKGNPAQVVELPHRAKMPEIRCRYLAPFGRGYLVVGKFTAPREPLGQVYYVDSTQSSVRRLVAKGVTDFHQAVVINDTAYLIGANGEHDLLRSFDGRSLRSIELPPGDGKILLGRDGEALIASRERSLYRLERDSWKKIVMCPTDIPFSLGPLIKVGDRVYLRDEGKDEENKRLWWIDIAAGGKLVAFDEDCSIAGANGAQLINVWSYLVQDDGQLWIAAGGDRFPWLVQWNPRSGYRIALADANVHFEGKFRRVLVGSVDDPNTANFPPGGQKEKYLPLAMTGLVSVHSGGDIECVGNHGIYRVTATEIIPELAFTKSYQDIELNNKSGGIYHWPWLPTHILNLPNGGYLIGGHWGGLYILKSDAYDVYRLKSLDDNLGQDISLEETGLPQ
jgi:hypothetical protein